MDQTVDVIGLIKIQVIHDFEKILTKLESGNASLNLTSILNGISFIEDFSNFKNPEMLGSLISDLTDIEAMDQLNKLL